MPAAKSGGKAGAKKAPAKTPATPPKETSEVDKLKAENAKLKEAAAAQAQQSQPIVQDDNPDRNVVTDDAGRPETHDNFGDEDTGEE